VIVLPVHCDEPAYVKGLDEVPGMLALAMQKKVDPVTSLLTLEPYPFIVPGARFNEMYYWDSVSQTCVTRTDCSTSWLWVSWSTVALTLPWELWSTVSSRSSTTTRSSTAIVHT
jgi:hypothetical protein